MMNAMDGRMVQQLAQRHRLPGAATDCKFHCTPEILVPESRQKLADARFDVAPQVE
jgi:hypothetical protein